VITIVTLRFGSKPYFEISARQLERYAARHGYALSVVDGSEVSDDRDLRWAKVPAVVQALSSGADLALYLDADCLVADESRTIESLLPLLGTRDLLVGRDSYWNANTGVMLATSRAVDILSAWQNVPLSDPETAHTWPVDELGFNRHVWPRFGSRIACHVRRPGTETDLIDGPFVKHFANGSPEQKAQRMSQHVL
jgi:hypothetical protein